MYASESLLTFGDSIHQTLSQLSMFASISPDASSSLGHSPNVSLLYSPVRHCQVLEFMLVN